MNAETKTPNIGVVREFLKLQYEGKIEEAFNNYASENFSWVVSTRDNRALADAIPWAGYSHHGLEGYKTLMSGLFGEYEALEFDPREFYEVSDKVFLVGYFRFKHYKTGKLAESDFVGMFNMKDGKISGGQFFENTYAVAAARM